MNDRTPIMLAIIAALVAVGLYLNIDIVRPGHQPPSWLLGMLSWQPEQSRSVALRRGLDLQGGLQVLLAVDREKSASVQPGDLDTAANVIKNRVDILGVTEALVQTQGEDKIVVELPGVADPDLAVKTIGETALLEFIYAGSPDTSGIHEGEIVTTTEPVLYSDLPENDREPRLYDAEGLAQLRSMGAAIGGRAAATAVTTDTGATATTPTEPATEPATSSPAATAKTTSGVTSTAALSSTTGLTETGAITTTGGITNTGSLTETGTTAATDAVTNTGATTKTFASKVYPTVVTGDHVQRATAGIDTLNPSQFVVSFGLDGAGGGLMQRFTADHIGDVMAIALDKRVISAPVVRATIASDGQITGNFTEEEANSLVAQLESGALPVSLRIVGQTQIGPTLGREAVHMSVMGGLLGMLAVMLFMLLYYRMPGLLADAALAIYALLAISLFRLIPVTLTLAGIAGFVLSIGMAVDANILIFERMKEELRSGRSIRAAMDIGFRRAWPSIRDSNLSTLITCAILFWFGSQFGASIVKGFAVTLALGVLTSLFTAITVTRTFLHVSNKFILTDQRDAAPMESSRLRALFGF